MSDLNKRYLSTMTSLSHQGETFLINFDKRNAKKGFASLLKAIMNGAGQISRFTEGFQIGPKHLKALQDEGIAFEIFKE